MSRFASPTQFPIELGRVVNLLSARFTPPSFVRFPIESGRPVNWLSAKMKLVISVRSPKDVGTAPASPFSWKSRLSTCASTHVTPSQVHTLEAVSQFILCVQFGPLVALYRSMSACRSAAGTVSDDGGITGGAGG